MGMSWETAAGRDPIFVDHAQRAETHPLGIGVIVETESMAGLQPAVVAAATLLARSDGHHDARSYLVVVTTISVPLDVSGGGRIQEARVGTGALARPGRAQLGSCRRSSQCRIRSNHPTARKRLWTALPAAKAAIL